jgi:hypothetical protein
VDLALTGRTPDGSGNPGRLWNRTALETAPFDAERQLAAELEAIRDLAEPPSSS